VSLAAHTAPAAQLTPRAKLPVSKELRIAPGCACNPLLRSPKVVSQPLVSPRRPQCKHAVAIAVATPVALAALADEDLRATPVQLCGTLGARYGVESCLPPAAEGGVEARSAPARVQPGQANVRSSCHGWLAKRITRSDATRLNN